MAIREIARRLDRDVRAVHSDIHFLLLRAGEGCGGWRFAFPYDAIHVDFLLRAGVINR